MKKKLLFVSMILALLFVFTACSGNKASETPDNNNSNETEETKETNSDNSFLVSDEPIELTFHYHYGDQFVYDEDLLVFKKAAELTNVHLKGTASKNATDSQEVFNLMMASGDIPDIVHKHLRDINEYGPQGAFIPLNDLIEEHAPNFKAFLETEKGQEVKKVITATDGNIYAIPFVRDGSAERGWFIRQDWLDKLGLEVPTTTEEYYEVLKAFKTQDPNGNGQADEVPYAARSLTYFQDLFYLWGAHNDMYIDANGELKYGPAQENYKEAMMNLAKWYDEGLLDKEIFTRGQNTRVELAANNTLGSTHDWIGSTAGVNMYRDEIEGFNFAAMPPPENTEGERFERSRRRIVGEPGWAISHSNPHPEETMKFFDFWWSEEGRTLMNWGVEGETYNIVDGQKSFTDEILSQENVAAYVKHTYGIQFEIGFEQDFDYEKSWMDPNALEAVEMYDSEDWYIPLERFMPQVNYTPEEQEERNKIYTALKTFTEEKLQDWILSGDPAKVENEWDSFVKTLEDMGYKEYEEITRTAYDRYQSQS